ncbi:MAG TPA: PEGA domain-containing protein [Terriglobales bacterium]|nr:PEGA domain-containing protein [Terriglobales bacterium]
MLRYPVAHYHGIVHHISHKYGGGSCYGYLYISRDILRYKVRWPEKDKGHGFQLKRADLTAAGEWQSWGSGTEAAEFKFRDGVTHRFFYMPKRVVESSGERFLWGEQLAVQGLLEGVQNVDGVVAVLKAREAGRAAAARDAAPQKAQPQATPQPAPATLRVSSQPGGVQVYLDNEPKGMTSAQEGELVLKNLPAGEYRVRLSLADYEDWTNKVKLAAGQDLKLEAKLAPRGPRPFTVQDVVDMLLGGISPKRAATLIQERGVDFVLNDKTEQQIRAAGGDSDLLLAIAKAKK